MLRDELKILIKELSVVNPKNYYFNVITDGYFENLSFIESQSEIKKNKVVKVFDDQVRRHKKNSLELSGNLKTKEQKKSFVDNSQFFDIKEEDLFSD